MIYWYLVKLEGLRALFGLSIFSIMQRETISQFEEMYIWIDKTCLSWIPCDRDGLVIAPMKTSTIVN